MLHPSSCTELHHALPAARCSRSGPPPNSTTRPSPLLNNTALLSLPPLPPMQAVKAMRYGEGGGAVQEFEDATALREKQEEELAAALEEDDDF